MCDLKRYLRTSTCLLALTAGAGAFANDNNGDSDNPAEATDEVSRATVSFDAAGAAASEATQEELDIMAIIATQTAGQALEDILPELLAQVQEPADLARVLQRGEQRGFPPTSEIEYERSIIRLPIYPPGPIIPGRPSEIVEVTAFMKLVRGLPVRNRVGFRQFEFTIENWELYGYSKLYDANITFTVSKDVIQPRSICIALQKEKDYPAIIIYNAIYDVYLDQKCIVKNQPGVAMARGVVEIPPRNITVAFQKPFMSQDIIFCPGTCEDMRSITKEEFLTGIRVGQAIREGRADLRDRVVKGNKEAGK